MSYYKAVIVTGANKGLGYAIVKKICENNKDIVYLTSRDEQRGKDACEKLKQLGLNPEYYPLDITDANSILEFRSFINKKNLQISVLINNAGILFLKDDQETKLVQAEQTLLVNFTALVNFTESILPFISNSGKIINISSSSGHLSRIPSEELRKKISSPNLTLSELKALMNAYVEAVSQGREIDKGWGDSAYVVSKVGVNAYTFMLHRRLADKGILVNCVHPGYVISDMTRGSGNVLPEDAANTVLKVTLESKVGGQYVWHDGTVVPWDGPDPRGYIDGKKHNDSNQNIRSQSR